MAPPSLPASRAPSDADKQRREKARKRKEELRKRQLALQEEVSKAKAQVDRQRELKARGASAFLDGLIPPSPTGAAASPTPSGGGRSRRSRRLTMKASAHGHGLTQGTAFAKDGSSRAGDGSSLGSGGLTPSIASTPAGARSPGRMGTSAADGGDAHTVSGTGARWGRLRSWVSQASIEELHDVAKGELGQSAASEAHDWALPASATAETGDGDSQEES